MTLNEYQALAARTINKKLGHAETELHALHGMSAEVGEIHSKYQKYYQGHTVDEGELILEVGDLLWMIAEMCTVNDWTLDDVCKLNIDKLRKRYPDGFSPERSRDRRG